MPLPFSYGRLQINVKLIWHFYRYNTYALQYRLNITQKGTLMKKVFAAFVAAALVCGLAGCGSSNPEDESSYLQVEGKTDEESVATARSLIQGLIDAPAQKNLTEIDTIKTSTESDGQKYSNTVITTYMTDLIDNEPNLYIKTETRPAAETDATYYIHGKNGVMEVGEERAQIEVTDQYINSILNPDQNTDFRIYYDCAEKISYYNGGTFQTVMLVVSPEQLMATGKLATFKTIESCIAEYTFDEKGQLSTFLNTVKGTVVDDNGKEVAITIDTKCLYTDYGTTKVPDLPEVPEDAQATDPNGQ